MSRISDIQAVYIGDAGEDLGVGASLAAFGDAGTLIESDGIYMDGIPFGHRCWKRPIMQCDAKKGDAIYQVPGTHEAWTKSGAHIGIRFQEPTSD